MKLNIAQIRSLIQEQNYLADKSILPSDVKTGRQYEFTCEYGHTFPSTVSNVYQSGKFGCPICSGRRVLVGFNDLWTTHPDVAMKLKNKEDGYKYSAGSNVNLSWTCPDCGAEKLATPNKMTKQKRFCDVCGHDISYSEKFVSNLLKQLNIHFEKEKSFDWSESKRYDFYLPSYNCIIETHGKQHYTSSDFSYLSGKTYIEEQCNDHNKMVRAIERGKIKNYIVLDCRESEMDWIRRSVLESDLQKVLQVDLCTIDWNKCHEFAVSNVTKLICQIYEECTNIGDICAEFNMCHNSIVSRLKQGAQLGWCTYDATEAIIQARKENGERVVRTRSKPILQMDMDNNVIAEFSSIQEAQRTLSISHIWDCLVGKRQSAGGFKWRYKYDD